MHKVAGRDQHDAPPPAIAGLPQHFVSAERKRFRFGIENWQVGPHRAQVAGAREGGHGQHKVVGADAIARRQRRECRVASKIANMGEGPRERHVGQRHLARAVGRQGHPDMAADKLDIGATDNSHFDLVEAALKEPSEGAGKRDLAPARQPGRR